MAFKKIWLYLIILGLVGAIVIMSNNKDKKFITPEFIPFTTKNGLGKGVEQLKFNINDKDLSDELVITKKFFVDIVKHVKEKGFDGNYYVQVFTDNGFVSTGISETPPAKPIYYVKDYDLAPLATAIALLWSEKMVDVQVGVYRMIHIVYSMKDGEIIITRFEEAKYNEVVEAMRRK